MPEIVIDNLSKVFTTKDGTVEALRNVNISIDKGDIYGIIGMSGAGKSTLVRCMKFLEQPTEGKINTRVVVEGKGNDQVYVTFQIGDNLEKTELLTVGKRNASVGIHTVGEDALTAVSEDYNAPFTFEGTLHKVVIDVAPFALNAKEELDKFFMLD